MRQLISELLREVRGNALWDILKTAGWGVILALWFLARLLKSAPDSVIVGVLGLFWVGSLLVFIVLEKRRIQLSKPRVIVPVGVDLPKEAWGPKLISASAILAVLWILVGIAFRIWFQLPKTLPSVTIRSLDGLPEGIPQDEDLKLHTMQFRNDTDFDLRNLIARVQLPEPVSACVSTNYPPGTSVSWKPITEEVTVSGTGDRSTIGPSSAVNRPFPHLGFFPNGAQGQVTKLRKSGDLTGVWELMVDKVDKQSTISVSFLTSKGPDATNYLDLVNTQFATNGAQVTATIQGTTSGAVVIHNLSFTATLNANTNFHFGTNGLRLSIEGQFQYYDDGKLQDQRFLVPLLFDSHSRTITAHSIRANDGDWRRIIVDFP